MSGILVFLKITGAVVAFIVVMFALYIFQGPIEAWFDVTASRFDVLRFSALAMAIVGYFFHAEHLNRISMLKEQNERLSVEIRALRDMIVRLHRELEKKPTKRSNADQ